MGSNIAADLEPIYNDGERLIPGESHDREEVVRHKSSYEFFYRIIEADLIKKPMLISKKIKILDIGSGTGHGTFMLSKLPGVTVIGIEPGKETALYAQKYYSASNIQYINTDLESFSSSQQSFDYIVSRHALEHIIDGLDFALKIPFANRLMVNVPFNEDDRNPFHLVHWIDERSFDNYLNKEFFYESLSGVTSLKRDPENPPNSIICVSTMGDLDKVSEIFDSPLAPWRPEFLQDLGLSAIAGDRVARQRESEVALRESELFLRESEVSMRESEVCKRESEVSMRESVVSVRESEVAVREVDLKNRTIAYDNLILVRLWRKFKRLVK